MKIICIGRNYTQHIAELHNERPDAPVVFLKPDSSILLKQHPFVIPEFTNDVHHEVEVLVKINKVGKYIDQKFAPSYYDEIGLGIDFTARDVQDELKKKGLPWEKAKAFDGSAVIGEFFPKSDFQSMENINFELQRNGEVVQKGNTSHMLWTIDALISYVSQYFTLKKGDVIFTGTPAGVAKVQPNDILEGYLEGKKTFRIQVK
ncbi:fumarylacetoacetate hydrolase family protein [Flavobacterium sp. N1719]|jgi:2-keto-4-pentenoate hydratase/2-oxohepta-3-ene-1,7-dioic acid hydratase in catechol pathway|uniref:fumarylacetoacetate hydrolase family protein n=1 Tax=Flavobacterium sp. N1719 TaxID=2885633 RepID=UPI002222A5B5|nr:fumarylacetoacetate hydrolase family protein [Flavobacterium sp. N1719]